MVSLCYYKLVKRYNVTLTGQVKCLNSHGMKDREPLIAPGNISSQQAEQTSLTTFCYFFYKPRKDLTFALPDTNT